MCGRKIILLGDSQEKIDSRVKVNGMLRSLENGVNMLAQLMLAGMVSFIGIVIGEMIMGDDDDSNY